MMNIKELIHRKTDQYLDEVTHIRRHLHRNPELSFEERKTSRYIRDLLDQWNVSYTYPFAENGILASIEGADNNGPVIALRSDMDGLPIQEETNLDFASVNEGVMHACGHDIHMASLLGAIRILNEMKDHINGRVLFIFQPGEEKLPGGAKLMLDEGVFDKFKPDMIIAQHVLPEMEAGKVGFRKGAYMASSDEIYISVKGKGGHAALPENINDPVLMTSHILISLQQEINRRSPKGIPTVLSFGKVNANGAMNVIPDEVKLEGTFRTMNEVWRNKAHGLIRQISEGIASSMGGSVKLEIRPGYPALYNDPNLTQRSRDLASELLGNDHVTDMDIRMTAEDFAWFSLQYPAMMFRLGIRSPETEEVQSLHSSRFIADERSLKTGVSILAWLTINLLQP
ncbi:MAG: M20 family metallopeptidase [Bacteroidales bacterium]